MTTEEERDPDLAVEALVEAYCDQSVDDYLARGRSLAALDDQAPRERHVQAYKAWAADVKNPAYLRDVADMDAEFKLRDQYPPFELVSEEMEVVLALAREVIKDTAVQKEFLRQFESIAKALDPKSRN
jgi:hypothetical protein